MTPHEEAMERLARRIALASQYDSARPTEPTTDEQEDET